MLRHESMRMFMDSTFDVIAKAFYDRMIVDVHDAAFACEDQKVAVYVVV